MTFLLNHNTDETIAADYELSERLGRELEAAGCEPLAAEPAAVKVTYMTRLVGRWAVTDTDIEFWFEQHTTKENA